MNTYSIESSTLHSHLEHAGDVETYSKQKQVFFNKVPRMATSA